MHSMCAPLILYHSRLKIHYVSFQMSESLLKQQYYIDKTDIKFHFK